MTTTLELHVRKIQWFCQQGEGFCMHVFSSICLTNVSVCHIVLPASENGERVFDQMFLNLEGNIFLLSGKQL